MAFIAVATLSLAVILAEPLRPRARRNLIDRAAFTDVWYVSFMVAGFCKS